MILMCVCGHAWHSHYRGPLTDCERCECRKFYDVEEFNCDQEPEKVKLAGFPTSQAISSPQP